MIIIGLIVFCAFCFDFVIGDPYFLWHPICGIGFIISKTEKILRKIFYKNKKSEFIGGCVLFFIVVGISFFVPFFILYIAYKIHFLLFVFLQIVFCTQIFAANSLKKETMKIYDALVENDIEKSRLYLSYVVGRNTENLSREEIIKATVETIAENTSDGVTAPLIYMLIGGGALGFFYKAVNTLDSMVGYKNEKYLYFGRFSAKADDVFNFIPSRITALFMLVSVALLKFNFKNSVKIFFRDRNKTKSPNAGQSESVFAGALEICLGGDCYYFSKLYKKEKIGDEIRKPQPFDIIGANKIMYLTSFLMTFVFSLIFILIGVVFCV